MENNVAEESFHFLWTKKSFFIFFEQKKLLGQMTNVMGIWYYILKKKCPNLKTIENLHQDFRSGSFNLIMTQFENPAFLILHLNLKE